MLTIKVRPGDAIAIGKTAVITVSSVNGKDMMRLAIAAPASEKITHARAGQVIDDSDPAPEQA